jgi:hypothetical protein
LGVLYILSLAHEEHESYVVHELQLLSQSKIIIKTYDENIYLGMKPKFGGKRFLMGRFVHMIRLGT